MILVPTEEQVLGIRKHGLAFPLVEVTHSENFNQLISKVPIHHLHSLRGDGIRRSGRTQMICMSAANIFMKYGKVMFTDHILPTDPRDLHYLLEMFSRILKALYPPIAIENATRSVSSIQANYFDFQNIVSYTPINSKHLVAHLRLVKREDSPVIMIYANTPKRAEVANSGKPLKENERIEEGKIRCNSCHKVVDKGYCSYKNCRIDTFFSEENKTQQ